MAQYMGLLVLRLADSRILPHNYPAYATQLQVYYEEAATLATSNNITIDFTALSTSLTTFASAAKQIESIRQSYLNDPDVPAGKVETLNEHLYLAERKFLNPNGLPQRKWFKHIVQAPGLDEGYNASVFPGLIQAINSEDQTQSQQQADLIATFVTDVAQYLAEMQ